MSDTPKTDEEYMGWETMEEPRDFSRNLERENTHLLVLAANAEFNASKAERENARLRKCMQYMIDNGYTIGMCGQTSGELCDDLLSYLP